MGLLTSQRRDQEETYAPAIQGRSDRVHLTESYSDGPG